ITIAVVIIGASSFLPLETPLGRACERGKERGLPGQEGPEGGQDRCRGLLGKEVAAGDRPAPDVLGPSPPDAEGVPGVPRLVALAPKGEHGARDPAVLPRGRVVL